MDVLETLYTFSDERKQGGNKSIALELSTVLFYNPLRITCGGSCYSVAGATQTGGISKRISKIFLEIGIPYGVRDFSRFEQKRAENPCKHRGFSFFNRLLSSRKIRHFSMGDCALKTVWEQSHKGSNPFFPSEQ